MSRPTIDIWSMQVAQVAARRATCPRRAVGCILLDSDGIILASGYNGSPARMQNCNTHPCDGTREGGEDSCMAIHAEINALMQCSNIKQIHTVTVTCFPCFRCLKALLNTGMKELIYKDVYEGYEKFLVLPRSMGINVIKSEA